MKILAQKNIWGEYGYDRFLQSVEEHSDSYQIIDIIPFTDSFVQPLEIVPDYVFGSGRFVNVCRSLDIPTFPSFGPIDPELFHKDMWINGDGYETTWGELVVTKPVFVKPFTEKFFTGTVLDSSEDKEKVQLATSFIQEENDEKVWVSPISNIEQEVRFFVIGGQIISGSVYKVRGVGNHRPISIDSDAWNAAKKMLNLWKYDGIHANYNHVDIDGFVLDIGLVDGKWKIVELNNLNSAGFYKCDTDAIVRALKYLK